MEKVIEEKTDNPLINNEPVEKYKIIVEAPQLGVERFYFWILNFLKDKKPYGFEYKVEKLQDLFTMSETSAYFGATEQKKAVQQDRANQYLKVISDMLKGLFQIVRELRIIDERVNYYEDAEKGNESAEIALKGIWIDRVEGGAKNPGSVYGLAATVGFSILPDLFFAVHPKNKDFIDKKINRYDNTHGLKLNRKMKELLKRKLYEYAVWKENTHKEIATRRKFNLKYLRQHYDTIRLHMNWVRPYLRNAQRLAMKERGMYNPEIVSAFDTTFIELETLGLNPKYEKYYPCVRLKFQYTTIPHMSYQEEYQRGAIHTGRTEIKFEGYVLTKEQIDEYKKKLQEEDFELLGSIEQAMEALGDDLKDYLIEAGEKFGVKKDEEEEDKRYFLTKWLFPKTKKEKKPKVEYTSPLEPILALGRAFAELFSFLGFSKEEKKKKKVLEPEKNKAEDEVKVTLLVTYDIFKKNFGMFTW